MFVVPLCVVIAWGYDIPLSLDFHPFETCTLLLTVVLVAFLIQVSLMGSNLNPNPNPDPDPDPHPNPNPDPNPNPIPNPHPNQHGESNWLQGLMLVVAYCIVSMGFFVHCDQNGEADGCPTWPAADEL